MSNIRVEVTPQAQSYFGVVCVPKDVAEPMLEDRFQEIKHTLPKIQHKGFRPREATRADVDAQMGGSVYGTIWRDLFISSINKESGQICYSDNLEVMDRGNFYEISGLFYYFPRMEISKNLDIVDILRTKGDVWVRDLIINDTNLNRMVDSCISKYTSLKNLPEDAPIKYGESITVEIDSEVNRGFGGTPGKAMWELNKEKLPDEIINCFVGKQVGNNVIFSMPKEVAGEFGKYRASAKILAHAEKGEIDLEALKKEEEVDTVEKVRENIKRKMEIDYEKNKASYFFRCIAQFFYLSPIPASLIWEITEHKVAFLKNSMGDKEFNKAYGENIDAVKERFSMETRSEAASMFTCHLLCQRLNVMPTNDEVLEYIQLKKGRMGEDTKIYATLELCKEKILQVVMKIEPTRRTLIEVPGQKKIIVPGQGRAPRRDLKIIH